MDEQEFDMNAWDEVWLCDHFTRYYYGEFHRANYSDDLWRDYNAGKFRTLSQLGPQTRRRLL